MADSEAPPAEAPPPAPEAPAAEPVAPDAPAALTVVVPEAVESPAAPATETPSNGDANGAEHENVEHHDEDAHAAVDPHAKFSRLLPQAEVKDEGPKLGPAAVRRVPNACPESSSAGGAHRLAGNPTTELNLTGAGIRSWFKERLRLLSPPKGPNGEEDKAAAAAEHWNAETHLPAVTDFVLGASGHMFFAYDGPTLKAYRGAVPAAWHELLFFVRDPLVPLSEESLSEAVYAGVIRGSTTDSLLRLMTGLVVPAALANTTWPDSMKKEFSGQVHKFMATLTELTYQAKGQTVLYIPAEEIGDAATAAKEKDLVHRLESTLIHWTRQIKEVVNTQDNAELGEDSGPLAEIEFWRSRSVDLSGIRAQLDHPGVSTIVTVLEQAKSSYLGPFLNLSNLIQREAVAAEDNLKFLSSLEKPCEALAKANASQIPGLLTNLLHCIRMIWNTSNFYNTPERISGLLRKVSNEIINRCCAHISLPEIFEGDVDACMAVLRESIAAGEAWKRVYRRTAHAVGLSGRKWDFDISSIFAHIDAFVQRCRDVLEVCEAQMQFAPKTELPLLGGTRGPETTKSLLDIQQKFQRIVDVLRGLDYSILDVKATKWHDDYNTFKSNSKDLEVMMQNVMQQAFDQAASLATYVELLEAFHSMAMREAIKRFVDKKTSDCYVLFMQELNAVKKMFDHGRRKPPVYPSMPRFAGSAFWALSLSRRLEKPMQLLNTTTHYLSQTPEAAELRQNHLLTQQAIEQFIKTQHAEWVNIVSDPGIQRALDNFLISLSEDGSGTLVMNFDKPLLSLFSEVQYWERQRLEIPYKAMEMAVQREKFRVLREQVLQVVRDYNAILYQLDAEERALFADRIRYLDRRIFPAINKLTWQTPKHALDYYMKEARKYSKEVEATVTDYKLANESIAANCKVVAETLLVSIEKKRIYEDGEFERAQGDHRDTVRACFERVYDEIKSTMQHTYQTFAADGPEIQHEWIKYTQKVDKRMEDALRTTVKRSLLELSRALNGDAKTEVVPIFNVLVMLKKNRVELSPTVNDLYNMVHKISQELLTVLSAVPRFSKQPEPPPPQASLAPDGSYVPPPPPPPPLPPLPSFFDIISHDEDTTMKSIASIMGSQGVLSISDKVKTFLETWEKKYKHIWDQDKEAYIRRYEKAKKPLSAFEADILKYKEQQEEVQAEETISNMRFLRVDCNPLKQSLIGHCEGWVGKFTELLNNLAASELRNIHAYFEANIEALKKPLLKLELLADSVQLWQKLMDEKAAVEERFEPLQEKYATLEKFEVPLTEEEGTLRLQLPAAWGAFQVQLQDTEVENNKAKENFRDRVAKMAEAFVKEVTDSRVKFEEVAPKALYGQKGLVTSAQAFATITEYKAMLADAQKRQLELKNGMDIFAMQQPAYKELGATDRDLELLEAIWTVVREWDEAYNGWKDGLFRELLVPDMEEAAVRFTKRIVKLGRDIKSWPVWATIKEIVDSFKRTMPLIVDLRNQAMRERHWEQLMEAVGEKFDPHGPDFTLAKVTDLRLDQHAELIGELSTNASKELAIEQSLGTIAKTWEELNLELTSYKDSKDIYKMAGTEEVFAALEDNIVTLSTMKASRFFVVFEKQINGWEQNLSLVSETIESILAVQRSWMYLENIFIGSEDIRRQLPAESVSFDSVNSTFITKMRYLADTRNALEATTKPGMLATFNDMNAKLEKIQKSLENYLENKRQQFPRFYFLSSDDLLEILGQAKDPQNVQPHLKKCFEGIKKLEMHMPGTDGRKMCESTGVFSPDGEYLPFLGPCITEGRPEDWLNKVEASMFAATKKQLYKTLDEARVMKKEKWVKDYQGQCLITAGQIIWTAECEKALADKEAAKSALRQLKKKWIAYLNKLTGVTRSKLTKIERNKTVSLITIEVHARDVIEKLGKAGCTTTNDFEWVSQLRFYWDKERNDCIVRQVLSMFIYGYEYQGNNGRLVMTPLTDRCYMTLGAAMFTRRGGNPLGPAGTGKTETVKDFGKALARYVIVFNCSDGVDYKMTGKMLSGLAQTGAWACLDEFNRIEVEVLSVVATQIALVMTAIKAGLTQFNFLGTEIRLNSSCGIFVTMNPGYAGRSELPDNLKAIVRPVSMMVPDFTLIAEIMMFAEGFQMAKLLAKKMIAIMELSQQQLSKQDHYDYGLRSFVIPIARAAGAMKRTDPDSSEELIMYRTMRDLIMPKLVFLDLPLFLALLSDLFPGVEMPNIDGGKLRAALEIELTAANLQIVPEFVTKIVQVYDCKVARHGNMIVGKTGAGKSEAWKCLQRAMGRLKKEGVEEFERVHVYTINPLALSNDEIYGSFEESTREWQDGVLARIMRTVCKDESLDQKWILFDGPVDTLWIESMNTLLDDNKLLTLLSGERISMPAQVTILFEVEDLSQASPATVSRAGMIYLNVEDLGWWPYVTSWLAKKTDAVLVENLKRLMDKYVEAALEFRRKETKELVPTDRLSSVRSLCTLFDCFGTAENAVSPSDGPEQYVLMIEMWFLFAVIWSIGASVDEDGRKKFDGFMRNMDTRYPSQETVFDYWVDPKRKAWILWEEKLGGNYRPPVDAPFFKIVVPTVDTVRNKYVLSGLVGVFKHSIIVGNVGVGKTLVAQSVLETLPEGRSFMVVNMSAQTSSNSLQDTIEGKLEKRTKGMFAPAGGKKMCVFIDDFNMPKKSQFGFIPPLELLKLWVDNGFWYDRAKQEVKNVKDMLLLASMAPPGGGRNAFSQRILACFSLVNMTVPNDQQMRRVFGTLLAFKLGDFSDEIKPLSEPLTNACIEVYNVIAEQLLPTPSKMHYLFNTRDLSKVVQGVMQAHPKFYDSREAILQLWCHETFRIYGDRMWDHADKEWLKNLLDQKLSGVFTSSWKSLFDDEAGMPPYVSFMRAVDQPPYEPVNDFKALKEFLTTKLEDYALEPGKSAMDLVLFKDAIHHVCRIHRVLMQPRGNMLLVGVGGSGRKSLSKLATYVADLKCFQIEITKSYRLVEFHEDLKTLYRQTGVSDKPTVFLFDDTQIVTETFLEDVNNILASGEVPNLFTKEELQAVCEEVRPAAKKAGAGEMADQLYAYFIERVRANLHVVLCLSPIGEAFRERCRMFPGLINCTTIDWFTEWPADALFEVAVKQLEEEKLGTVEIKEAICKCFTTAHVSVSQTSAKMLQQLSRNNYVTPTNYLEFVNGYRHLLKEKRGQVGDKASKLKGGLMKLDETKVQVNDMQVVCRDKKVVVAKAKKDCEELLVNIVQEKRVADEQEKQVNAEAQRIEKEAMVANAVARECQEGLDKAMPALKAAEDALAVLTKKDVSELKAYAKPPGLVELTLTAVMTVLKKVPTWEEAKKQMGDASFLDSLIRFDKDQLVDALLKKINKYTAIADFTPEAVGKVSGAAKGMCLWVRAMETYGNVAKEVAPKRAKLKEATEQLDKKQKALAVAKASLAEVQAKVQRLTDTYESSTAAKEKLQAEAEDLELKLQRAEKLVLGLAGERTRWESTITELDEQIINLPGDCVVAAAFMSYAGPFPSEYRDELVRLTWLPQIKQLQIPSSADFNFANFLANPSDVRDWNIQGLPADSFSTENGVLVTRGRRWPLMVDPQGQANKWVKNMEGKNLLKVLNLQMGDMMRNMENAIQFGNPVLLQDVLEEIDPALEPILAKSFIKKGNSVLIKLGDKEIEYSKDFRLYITTKMGNPHYKPEVSTKATIVNFSVKEQGLEAQLLNIVVKKERPDLDKQKNELVVKVAQGKRTQADLEDEILRLLSESEGSLLDNVELINTLDRSKTTWEEVNESLTIAEETAKKIEAASQAYRPISIRAAILYFVLNDLSTIDPMYQFSLDSYNSLFLISIAKSAKSDNVPDRIKLLNDFHTYAVYRYTARGLFERHKLLLSLQVCVRILQSANQVNNEEWDFFLRGGTLIDKATQSPNPAQLWISEEAWDNITALENLANFKGILPSFENGAGAWEEWYRSKEPETAELPGEWESKCNELQRMILVRCLRQDRVVQAATNFVANSLGRKFVEPPPLDLAETLGDSTPSTPLIFVLSPGVDPTTNLQMLANSRGMGDKFHFVALGQGQAPIAAALITEGLKSGHWVFLANCHLMTSWLPTLSKNIEQYEAMHPHENFRLWLSSNPSPLFPIDILQRGIKMTTEPPKGIRANLLRIYGTVTEESFSQCKNAAKYSKLLFALTYFHSVLLERRKFRTLGLNIPYDFNDTDFQVSDDLLKTYLDEYEDTPWDALKYLISEANYGGRVTDELDRRVLNSYLNQFYCEDSLAVPQYPLSPLSFYYVPDHGSLQSFKDYIVTLPIQDRPEAFGQHPNADISFMIEDSRVVLESIVSLQPKTGAASGGIKREDVVMLVVTDLLAQVPKPFNLEDVMKAKADDPSALHVVLFQEIERYNKLLGFLRHSCVQLQKGIKGLVVMSSDLDEMFNALFNARVPAAWLKTYPSLKGLGSWTRDLLQRIGELRGWVEQGYPTVYWLAGFTYPTGFLTAVLQTTARRNGIPIDALSFEFTIVNLDEKEINQPPKEGVYIKGSFLEGGGWDFENGCLTEPEPMELIVAMPIIHFKPVENKKRSQKGIYLCPLYMYPVRTGTRERPSFMISIDIKAGTVDPDHWVKRGTALLLALAS